MKINVISGRNAERLPRLMSELEGQGIKDYELWPSIYLPSVCASINAAHKQIVEFAMLSQWPFVCIAEDDVKFTHSDSYAYLGGIYLGDIQEDKTVDYFCGLHLYIVSQRYYKTFLDTPSDEHIDRAQKGLGKFVVCYPFAAIQYEGYSNNTGKEEKYDQLLRGRELYQG